MALHSDRIAAHHSLPKYQEFYWPVIQALTEMGGSASISELYDRVVANMNLSERALAVPHGDGTTSEVEYRLAWARTYLKKVGAIDNSERGIWALTAKGRAFTKEDAANVVRAVRRTIQNRGSQEKEPANSPSGEGVVAAEDREIDWKEKLLARLKAMPSEAFERLCQRILRESGFVKVQVTGRSGDGGIDGAGVLRVNLVSFHGLFQSKRWNDAVSTSVIRDFRGAMIGGADKGLVMTTGARWRARYRLVRRGCDL